MEGQNLDLREAQCSSPSHGPTTTLEPSSQQVHLACNSANSSKPWTSVKFWDYRSIPSDHNAAGFGSKWVTNFNSTNRIKGLSHIFLVHWSTQWPCNHLLVTECKLQHPTCMCTHAETHTHTQENCNKERSPSLPFEDHIYSSTRSSELQSHWSAKMVHTLTSVL
jgi:hypothetical protein